jgi:hypothetical protein
MFLQETGPVDRMWAPFRWETSQIVKERDTARCYQTANPPVNILSA